MTWIDNDFPDARGAHRITSPQDGEYNCIAYAAGDKTEWWTHFPGYKWPARRTPLVEGLVGVFEALGFTQCVGEHLEPEFEKVALYAKGGFWKHAARQSEEGKWLSKLGPDEDIEHDSPQCLCGNSYGEVYCVMKRKRTKPA